ncbi:hypothetical protein OG976_23510 [Mycobacterium sp. NBC_00419]|uniref:hypothetical protein n=1 Tax=Mycobacterium sp. NBC_00419 TaxID=2975989 RepID=UPI002E1C848C
MANIINALRIRSVAVGIIGGAGVAVAIFGAGSAHADGLTTNAGSVDADGTQGSWAPAVTGSQRPTQGIQFVSRTFENGGCEIELGRQHCHTSALWSNASNDADSALGADAMQAAAVRGPHISATPGSKASVPRGY